MLVALDGDESFGARESLFNRRRVGRLRDVPSGIALLGLDVDVVRRRVRVDDLKLLVGLDAYDVRRVMTSDLIKRAQASKASGSCSR